MSDENSIENTRPMGERLYNLSSILKDFKDTRNQRDGYSSEDDDDDDNDDDPEPPLPPPPSKSPPATGTIKVEAPPATKPKEISKAYKPKPTATTNAKPRKVVTFKEAQRFHRRSIKRKKRKRMKKMYTANEDEEEEKDEEEVKKEESEEEESEEEEDDDDDLDYDLDCWGCRFPIDVATGDIPAVVEGYQSLLDNGPIHLSASKFIDVVYQYYEEHLRNADFLDEKDFPWPKPLIRKHFFEHRSKPIFTYMKQIEDLSNLSKIIKENGMFEHDGEKIVVNEKRVNLLLKVYSSESDVGEKKSKYESKPKSTSDDN